MKAREGEVRACQAGCAFEGTLTVVLADTHFPPGDLIGAAVLDEFACYVPIIASFLSRYHP
jgi:hypothetical protein